MSAELSIAPDPTALYKFYDEEGALLYVGITSSLPARLAQHKHAQPWWNLVTRVEVQHHPERTLVRRRCERRN